MVIVRCSLPKSLSTSLRISYGLTMSKNRSEIVFATKKLRPAWILVVCKTRMLLIGYQTTTLNLHHGATVIKKPSTTPTKPSPSSPTRLRSRGPSSQPTRCTTITRRTNLCGAKTLMVGAGSRVTAMNLCHNLGQSRMPRLGTCSRILTRGGSWRRRRLRARFKRERRQKCSRRVQLVDAGSCCAGC